MVHVGQGFSSSAVDGAAAREHRMGTLGMFIIDTFSFRTVDGALETPPDRGFGEQIGGAGSYAIAGKLALEMMVPRMLIRLSHR